MGSPIKDSVNVSDPSIYYCQIWSYLISHSLMLARAYQGDFLTGDVFYLLFEGVSYFEGPMSWQGTEFQIASTDECLAIMEKFRRAEIDDVPNRELLDYLHLFRCKTPQGEVQVLAYNLHKVKNIPGDFYWLLAKGKKG
jgi:hypothetical protein